MSITDFLSELLGDAEPKIRRFEKHAEIICAGMKSNIAYNYEDEIKFG